jgi:hypothetical protein
MSDDVAGEARAQLELAHRVHREILDVILRVADETGRDPGELAQLVAMGGGVQNMLQPLTMRWHEKRQQESWHSSRPPRNGSRPNHLTEFASASAAKQQPASARRQRRRAVTNRPAHSRPGAPRSTRGALLRSVGLRRTGARCRP